MDSEQEQFVQLYEQKQALSAELKAVNKELATVSEQLRESMLKQNLDQLTLPNGLVLVCSSGIKVVTSIKKAKSTPLV